MTLFAPISFIEQATPSFGTQTKANTARNTQDTINCFCRKNKDFNTFQRYIIYGPTCYKISHKPYKIHANSN